MTSNIKQLVLLLTVAACFQLVTLQTRRRLGEGDPCRLKNKEQGVCKLLSDCPTASQKLQETAVWPPKCSTRGDGVTIICCDESSSKPKPSTNKGQAETFSLNSHIKDTPLLDPGKISREKCEYYSKWEDDPLLLPGSTGKQAGECANVAQFVIGGKEAEPLEFPHMAQLGFGDRNNLQWGCGGSLISEQYVLTAGHCLQKKDGTNVSHVKLGSSDPRSTEIVKIRELIPHPKYDKDQFYYDIALLKLEKEIQFDNYKRPACLQVNRIFDEDKGIASGWGKTENGTAATKLMKVQLPFKTNEACRVFYNNAKQLPYSIDDRTQFCAGGEGKDTCQGDSGGPIQLSLKEPNCMYSILGVTSFGLFCGQSPGVYSRVSAFVPWIEKEVWLGK